MFVFCLFVWSREYTYYLPKHLLPDNEALEKFRALLNQFVGTHSFHNFASTKGRQLKEVRKRVQASIDLKKAAGGLPPEGGAAPPPPSSTLPDSDAAGTCEEVSAAAGSSGGKKRERSKEEWRTYRHKKMSAAERREEDKWYGKKFTAAAATGNPGAEQSLLEKGQDEEGNAGAAAQAPPDHETPRATDGVDIEEAVAVRGQSVTVDGDGDEAGVGLADGTDAGVSKEEGMGGEGNEGPEKVLLLRELRTRCAFFIVVF